MVFSKRGCAKDTDGPITYRPVQKTQTGSQRLDRFPRLLKRDLPAIAGQAYARPVGIGSVLGFNLEAAGRQRLEHGLWVFGCIVESGNRITELNAREAFVGIALDEGCQDGPFIRRRLEDESVLSFRRQADFLDELLGERAETRHIRSVFSPGKS
jgi:hypothetical protein